MITNRTLDNTGICISLACAVHCLAMPFLIVLLPLIGLGFLVSEPVELILLCGAILLSATSLIWGHKQHKKLYVFLFLIGAACLVFMAHNSHADHADHAHHDQHHHEDFEISLEDILHASIGILLATGHFINRRLCSKCKEC